MLGIEPLLARKPLAALTLIQVKVYETMLTAQIEPHQRVAMGDTVTLTCGPDALYLFDPESDAALCGIDTAQQESSA